MTQHRGARARRNVDIANCTSLPATEIPGWAGICEIDKAVPAEARVMPGMYDRDRQRPKTLHGTQVSLDGRAGDLIQ